MIIYKVPVSGELKEKIEQTIKGKRHELKAFKPFVILDEEKVIIGYGLEGGDVVIEQIVDLVFRTEMVEGEYPKKVQGKQFKLNSYRRPVQRPIISLNPEEAFKTTLKRNKKLMNILRHGR